ncbi:tyrosine-protein kinase STYK1 isoform X1 [Mus musculus]|uniref:Tyrosine-protein kinase STYK1 n=2 Tax=Mus musculus TaxID=10090 RepID=STYK1_MOUSE|nr:tyrosine-protein kinase STYK1 isoform a [Mus musculus]NP_001398610.1 tyrosine-protein kinase STYK1 isoform a [Mus musculus]NP_001398611.1 tyrosine-protein kinase STYK1 isoform a [Mus musculus]NP_766479.1 tyrosine-protein kinase STYK1 isoform a [Mus musculus]XP_006506194.1 tyrosine-protein kinase STYK1 isoform X1 [Mus musculus]XP_006506195.1 tyrosine-protein kinase STYK1 isoform X1 [Mus musculus]Q6J9G1.2 RecName: Full=Tyrosine-protein kinase STYK1; AltName: Full=Novel oncogene with kinase d|eukprot:NP_766479.1 tyrosine-protein kinase STYK1 [Mus musculus]
MGEKGHLSRVLLECSLSDKLCVVREKQYEVIIVPALLVGGFLILLAIILWLFIRGQRSQRQSPGPRGTASVPASRGRSQEAAGHGEKVLLPLKETSVEGFLRAATPRLAKLQVPREQLLEVLEQIHSGSCGTLYHATMTTKDHPKPKSVVLKALEDPVGLQEVQDFIGRIQFYQYLGKHKNLVQLEGCCTERLPLYMMLEDVVPGDLLSFLWTCRRDVMTMDGLLYDLTEKQIYHIGKQILLALEFLQEKHLFHGDVAARNILIQSDLTPKLCHLGLAYEVHAHGAISSARSSTIPLKWLAPERLLLRPASIRGDIWSFGILLYEMVTLGAPPYPEVPPTSILQYLQRKKIMKRPSSCSHAMYNIMKCCWRWSEDSRPLLGQLLQRLEAASRSADDKAVLQVPELVVPELYADVAGIRAESISYSFSVL